MTTTTPGHHRNARRGVVLTVLGAIFFALNASISKAALEGGLDPEQLTILRSAGAVVGLGLVVAVVDRSAFRVSRREVPQLVAYGVVGVALVQWLYFVAIDRLSVSLALLIEFTAPVLVALWARFALGEDVRARVWAALALALAGLAMVAEVWSGLGGLDGLGLLAAAGAAVCLAAYWLIGERAVNSGVARDPVSLSFWGFAFATVAWVPFMPARLGELDALGEVTSLLGRFADVRVPVWLLVVCVVVVGTITPFVLEVTALRHINATQVGLIAMLEPVLATVIAWLWLEQQLTTWQAVGVLVVVVGIGLAQTARGRTAPEPSTADAVPLRSG